MNFDYYRDRVSVNGSSVKEKSFNAIKEKIKKDFNDILSTEKIFINDIETDAFISSRTNDTEKDIISLLDNKISAGNIIKWKDLNWLMLSVDIENDVYYKGKMKVCNYLLKWQDRELKIKNYPVVSVTSSGTLFDNNIMVKGEEEKVIFISYCDDSLAINVGQRFFIDNNINKPTPYSVTKIDNVSNVIDNKGYIVISLKQDVLNNNDNIELGICNYKEKSEEETGLELYSKIESNNNVLIVGDSKGIDLYASFFKDNNEIKNIIPVFNIKTSNDKSFKVNINGEKINIICVDENLIGEHIRVSVHDKDNLYQEAYMILELVGMY